MKKVKITADQAQYITDAKGRKTGVILSLAKYTTLMDDLQDLAVIADRRNDPVVPFSALRKPLLKKHG